MLLNEQSPWFAAQKECGTQESSSSFENTVNPEEWVENFKKDVKE